MCKNLLVELKEHNDVLLGKAKQALSFLLTVTFVVTISNNKKMKTYHGKVIDL